MSIWNGTSGKRRGCRTEKNGQEGENRMQLIGYAACSTCKKAKKWLDAKGISYEERPIREQNPTVEELKEWHAKAAFL